MKKITGQLRWGIIGAGNVCEMKSGPAFNLVPNSVLFAIMRRNEEKARDFAFRHNVSKYYVKAKDLIDDPDINAVYIATPPLYHEEYAMMSMQAGKPVYIEKPVTLESASCERLIEASEKYNVPVCVAHYRRGLPLFNRIKELLDQEVLGRILFIRISLLQSPSKNIVADTEDNWRIIPEISGGGLFHDLAPHQLDLMCWYFGEPQFINGQSMNQGGLYNAPDTTRLEAIFREDIYLNGFWSFIVPAAAIEDKCFIVGTKGSLEFSFFREPFIFLNTDSRSEKMEFAFPQHIQEPHIGNVVKYFRGEGQNPCSLKDALVSMQMIDSTR